MGCNGAAYFEKLSLHFIWACLAWIKISFHLHGQYVPWSRSIWHNFFYCSYAKLTSYLVEDRSTMFFNSREKETKWMRWFARHQIMLADSVPLSGLAFRSCGPDCCGCCCCCYRKTPLAVNDLIPQRPSRRTTWSGTELRYRIADFWASCIVKHLFRARHFCTGRDIRQYWHHL